MEFLSGLLTVFVMRVSIVYLVLSSAVLEELLAGSFSLELGHQDSECAREAFTFDFLPGTWEEVEFVKRGMHV